MRDAVTGAKSEWTLLMYLTGVEDGVKGGEAGDFAGVISSPMMLSALFLDDVLPGPPQQA